MTENKIYKHESFEFLGNFNVSESVHALNRGTNIISLNNISNDVVAIYWKFIDVNPDLVSASIMVDGFNLLKLNRKKTFFTTVQYHKHLSKSPNNQNIWMYSFSEKPECCDPTDTSITKQFTLIIDINDINFTNGFVEVFEQTKYKPIDYYMEKESEIVNESFDYLVKTYNKNRKLFSNLKCSFEDFMNNLLNKLYDSNDDHIGYDTDGDVDDTDTVGTTVIITNTNHYRKHDFNC